MRRRRWRTVLYDGRIEIAKEVIFKIVMETNNNQPERNWVPILIFNI